MIDARDPKSTVNADNTRKSILAALSFEENTKIRNDGGVSGVGIGVVNNGGNKDGNGGDKSGRTTTGIATATTPSKEAAINVYVMVPAGYRTSNYGNDGTGLNTDA